MPKIEGSPIPDEQGRCISCGYKLGDITDNHRPDCFYANVVSSRSPEATSVTWQCCGAKWGDPHYAHCPHMGNPTPQHYDLFAGLRRGADEDQLRDLFASVALERALKITDLVTPTREALRNLARIAYEIADAMLEARKRK